MDYFRRNYDRIGCATIPTPDHTDRKNLDDEFSASEGVAYIDFEHIVSEGDIIGFTEDSMERVVYVFNDGSFYSVIEPSPFAGEEAD